MEVRYAYLRPAQIIARREACPVAYIPIGNLEWHGLHNPVGADTLQAEALAIRCAEQGGGIVFPPLYYGENRLEGLMEANADDHEAIAAAMGLEPDRFTPDFFPFTATEQTLAYNHLLLHILAEADTLGFRVGVLVAGHYPLIDHCRAAVLQYMQRVMKRPDRLLPWAVVDYLTVNDIYPDAGDHAANWETSHMLAIAPETVDLSALPPRGAPLTGVIGRVPPQDATAAYGAKTLAAAADHIVRETRDRLEHPERYRGHGKALLERQWLSD
ncbi:MAG: creatininase family protein [Clostridiaceae bacterium]|nr:creatininase family protein [Clostridiaceae bacterium]